jgi:hypothetical protein
MKPSLWLAGLFYFLSLTCYSVFSYALTAPNLTLLNWLPYTQFQAWMWETLFNNRPLLTQVYVVVMVAVLVSYFLLMRQLLRHTVTWSSKSWPWVVASSFLLTAPLLLANNALSYDVFNYIFNAKMVLVYQANPHVQVALDFASDPWVRFMHNTHTPAPYGYGWTALSLIPFVLGTGKFLTTWLLFRVMSLVSLVWLGGVLWWALPRQNQKPSYESLALLFLNPLIVIEVIGTFHNDLWMMAPAVWALVLVRPSARKKLSTVLLSAGLLIFSISIKLATLTLIPLWLGLVAVDWPVVIPGLTQLSIWKKRRELLSAWWPVLASLLMFIPLLTSRSQQFHPWYLTWVLVWVPLFPALKNKWLGGWRTLIWTLSVTSLLRYAPYLWHGIFTPEIIWQQKMFTWLPAIAATLLFFFSPKTQKPGR